MRGIAKMEKNLVLYLGRTSIVTAWLYVTDLEQETVHDWILRKSMLLHGNKRTNITLKIAPLWNKFPFWPHYVESKINNIIETWTLETFTLRSISFKLFVVSGLFKTGLVQDFIIQLQNYLLNTLCWALLLLFVVIVQGLNTLFQSEASWSGQMCSN